MSNILDKLRTKPVPKSKNEVRVYIPIGTRKLSEDELNEFKSGISRTVVKKLSKLHDSNFTEGEGEGEDDTEGTEDVQFSVSKRTGKKSEKYTVKRPSAKKTKAEELSIFQRKTKNLESEALNVLGESNRDGVIPEEAKKDDESVYETESEDEAVKDTDTEGAQEPITKTKVTKKRKQQLDEAQEAYGNELRKQLSLPKLQCGLKEPIKVNLPAFYMNNRKIFVDFINNYFNDAYLSEVLDDSKTITCGDKSNDFEILVHQKILRDYMASNTPYRGVMVIHGLGSGKTCTSISVGEALKTTKKILVMTPAFLRPNFVKELKKCGDPCFRKNNNWEFFSISEDASLSEQYREILGLSEEYIKKQGGVWFIDASKPSNYDSLTDENKRSINSQVEQMILHKYEFVNYNGIRESHYNKMTNYGKRNPFDNKVIIIDESHRFVSAIQNGISAKKKSLFVSMYEHMKQAKNCKIVFLSGTPMINVPFEFGLCCNMLRGYIKVFKFNVQGTNVNEENIKNIITTSGSGQMCDVINLQGNTLKITRNPFGFKSKYERKTNKYLGVHYDEKFQKTDTTFIKQLTQDLAKANITVTPGDVDLFTAFPETKEQFDALFIDKDGKKVKNPEMFQRRLLGLVSYYRSANEKLMPRFNMEDPNHYKLEYVEMSDYQFLEYSKIRSVERNLEKKSKNKSSYRIYSRAYCNFVFPEHIERPTIKNGSELEELNEDDFDARDDVVAQRNDIDMLSNDNVELENEADKKKRKKNKVEYEREIQEALVKLKEDSANLFTVSALRDNYSPKFAKMVENMQADGKHLVYSAFRTVEGLGVFSFVLEENGYAKLRIKKRSNGVWELNVPESDRDKPKYVLYTGTESDDEKQILLDIYNGNWINVPSTITNELLKDGDSNVMGEIIKVFMITSAGAEGLDLKNVQFVHIMELYWHPIRIPQVIGRANRICSHYELPDHLRNVMVFVYISVFKPEHISSDNDLAKEIQIHDTSAFVKNKVNTSDETLYEITERKKTVNDQFLHLIKQAAVDCRIHTKKNNSEGLNCFVFGTGKDIEKQWGFVPSIQDEILDSDAPKQKVAYKKFKMENKMYLYDPETMEVFDHDKLINKHQRVRIGVLDIKNKRINR
jgi:hypothetical protein